MIDLPDTFMKQDGDHSSHTRAEDLESYIVTEPSSFFIMQGHTSSDQEDLYDEDSGTRIQATGRIARLFLNCDHLEVSLLQVSRADADVWFRHL